jgi:hypothetical protein
MDGRASYCVYATNNGNGTIWFLFRVAPVSEDIRLTCYVRRARDLRETRICIIDTVLDNNQSTTNFNTAYVPLQVIFVHVDKASIPTYRFLSSFKLIIKLLVTIRLLKT